MGLIKNIIPGRDSNRPSTSKRDEKTKKSALDEIREQQEWFKEKKNRKDYWLHEGIVVKVSIALFLCLSTHFRYFFFFEFHLYY